MEPSGDSLVRLVAHSEGGDAEAKDALFAALHAELHRLAQAHLHKSGGDLTLSPTTLLHEVYLDIAARGAVVFPDRQHFLGTLARHARPHHRLRAHSPRRNSRGRSAPSSRSEV